MLKEKFNFEELKNKEIDNFPIRKDHFNKFIEQGFPNKRLEQWKFSDLNTILNTNIKNFKFGFNKIIKNIDKQNVIKNFEHSKIFIVNGGLSLIDLLEVDKDKIQIKNENLIYDQEKNNSLNNLNLALSNSLIRINVLDGQIVEKPLVIYNIYNSYEETNFINSRFEITLEKNSSLSMLSVFDEKIKNCFSNLHSKIILNKNSNFKNYIFDNNLNENLKYNFSNIDIYENSISENFIYSSESKFSKNEIICNLKEKYSSAFINGVINLDQSKQHEIQTNINHLAENTKSYQLIKSILNDKAKGVYQGKIFVNEIAQKTDGYQLSKALLLDENTEFNGKPELEIYADDVKCSHGSTSGNLDENAIFYLMSRGLDFKQAKKLLIEGFINDVIEKITNTEIQTYIKGEMKI
jgi:Fe-S cluster assembly protein SufD